MILAAFTLAAVTVTFSPPAPTVGDLIAVQFDGPVALDPSPSYEIVRTSGSTAVVRTFSPRPFAIGGTTGDVRFRNLVIPVRSVLKPNDRKPAPLAPPREVPYPRLPFIAIAIAAVVAAVIWFAVWRRSRRATTQLLVVVSPEDRYRRIIEGLLADPGRRGRWGALADATREYLARRESILGTELTTTELLVRLKGRIAVIEPILRNGDYEKFAPSAIPPPHFDDVAREALALADPEPSVEADVETAA